MVSRHSRARRKGREVSLRLRPKSSVARPVVRTILIPDVNNAGSMQAVSGFEVHALGDNTVFNCPGKDSNPVVRKNLLQRISECVCCE
jgi:hypothetical protein